MKGILPPGCWLIVLDSSVRNYSAIIYPLELMVFIIISKADWTRKFSLVANNSFDEKGDSFNGKTG